MDTETFGERLRAIAEIPREGWLMIPCVNLEGVVFLHLETEIYLSVDVADLNVISGIWPGKYLNIDINGHGPSGQTWKPRNQLRRDLDGMKEDVLFNMKRALDNHILYELTGRHRIR